jgi:hypothetical protein
MENELLPILGHLQLIDIKKIESLKSVPREETFKDFDMNFDIDQINEYLILPTTFIKMLSRFFDTFISGYCFDKTMKKLKSNLKIYSKMSLTKYHTTRILLEIIFKRQNTEQLDFIFNQLKLYGSHIIQIDTSYQEIIQYIKSMNEKSNSQTKEEIEILLKKKEKTFHDDVRYDLSHRITIKRTQIQSFTLEEIDNEVYKVFTDVIQQISIVNRQLIISKINGYLATIETPFNPFKVIDDYTENDGTSMGCQFEDEIYEKMKPLTLIKEIKEIKENGFQIIKNVILETEFQKSGIKLEYDFIIGKIIDNSFVIYAVFEAKISNSLIPKDVDKFTKGIKFLVKNELLISDKTKKELKELGYSFNKFLYNPKICKDIIFGYLYKNESNYQRELFKTFSKYIVANTDNLFKYIEGSKIQFSHFIQDFHQNNQKEYQVLCDKLENIIVSQII